MDALLYNEISNHVILYTHFELQCLAYSLEKNIQCNSVMFNFQLMAPRLLYIYFFFFNLLLDLLIFYLIFKWSKKNNTVLMKLTGQIKPIMILSAVKTKIFGTNPDATLIRGDSVAETIKTGLLPKMSDIWPRKTEPSIIPTMNNDCDSSTNMAFSPTRCHWKKKRAYGTYSFQ